MYTNADLKISLYVCAHIKQCPESFAILIPRIFELFAREVCKCTYSIVSECV